MVYCNKFKKGRLGSVITITRGKSGGAETATKLCARRITVSAKRNHSGSGTKAICAVVARNSPSELVVEFSSLGDSTSLCASASLGAAAFCSELCVSCPTLLRNWIITCQAAATFSRLLLYGARSAGMHMMPPKALGAYLAILIAQQKCSMGVRAQGS